MKNKILLLLSVCFSFVDSFPQSSFYGEVKERVTRQPVPGAVVLLSESPVIMQQTDANGHFHFFDLPDGVYLMQVSQLGYKQQEKHIIIGKDKSVIVYLDENPVYLKEVTVSSLSTAESTLSSETVGKKFMLENNSLNFSKTLSKISGVSSMDIGSGFSKPVIRGMGFNRVVVADKGINQQDQQWGADHGLGIDQYDMEEIIVHKGPMSLQFGSDAIGGAIEIKAPKIPFENCYYGDVLLIGKSNNDLLGLSVVNNVKVDKWFVKARYTHQRYSDYRVPAEHVYYLNRVLPVYHKRLKNTAGTEHNASVFINYSSKKLTNSLNVTNVYQKNGFFPGAHGIPDAARLEHDGSFRNIDLPYSNMNHFKVIDNLALSFNNMSWITDVGFQYNHRQEWASFHTHYQNQPLPEKDPNLELDFKLCTYTLNTKLRMQLNEKWQQTIGIQNNLQHHNIGGYNYLMPAYEQFTTGLYWLSHYKPSGKWKIDGGVRYDVGMINITGFYDPVLAEYLQMQGYDNEQVLSYAQRAYDTEPRFHNFSLSAGSSYDINEMSVLKLNAGKSFRFPTANELASNGVHHGAFRHEQGDPDLKAEQGYQLDVSYHIRKNRLSFSLSPYVSYFSNYIYLSPTGEWSVLPHAGQIYKYKMSEAFFAGGEYQFQAALFHLFELNMTGQYVWNKNLSDNYPLPFTPPFSLRNEISYSGKYKVVESYRIFIEHEFYAPQNRIARNEEKTSGTNLFNAGINTNVKLKQFRFMLSMQIQNIFNTKYMNHLSFYRKLELPEPGRNIQLLLRIPFHVSLRES